MNGPGHYAVGASAGLVYAQLAPVTWWQGVLAIPAAAGFSYGAVSPDIDQSWLWRRSNDVIPDAGSMGHRRITHSWMVFAIPSVLWWFGPHDPWFGLLFALTGAILAGWWSHLFADFLVGGRSKNRGPGIPLILWWCHVGLGFKCGGWAERIVSGVVVVGVLAWTARNAWQHLPDTQSILAGIGL